MLKIMLVISIFGALTGCAANKNQIVEPQALEYEDQVQSYREEAAQDYFYRPIESAEKYVNIKQLQSQPQSKPKSKPKSQCKIKSVRLSFKQIQQALRNAGFYNSAIDGKIGPKTKTAIMKFQKSKGLKSDGIVGKKTSCELNKYLTR